MLTALVGSCVVKASAGLKGKKFTYRCRDPKCNGEVILICSDRYLTGQTHDVRTAHFRHKHNYGCSYCENEGPWHREWKSHFDRVEVRYPDFENGTLNIADAVVGENFVIEIQHYHIALKERDAREGSYKPNGGMLWILDVNHRNALAKLRNAGEGVFKPCTASNEPDHFEIANPVALFPEEWTKSTVAVVFDYGPNHPLLRLYPGRTRTGMAVVQKIEKDRFIEELKRNPTPFAKEAGALFKPQTVVPPRTSVDVGKELAAMEDQQRQILSMRRPTQTLMPTNTQHLYRDKDGRLYSDYFGQLLPYSKKFAAAIRRDQQKKAHYSRYPKRRKWY